MGAYSPLILLAILVAWLAVFVQSNQIDLVTTTDFDQIEATNADSFTSSIATDLNPTDAVLAETQADAEIATATATQSQFESESETEVADPEDAEALEAIQPRPLCHKWERLNSTAQAGVTPRRGHLSWPSHDGKQVFVAGGCYHKEAEFGLEANTNSETYGLCSYAAGPAMRLNVETHQWNSLAIRESASSKTVDSLNIAEAASAYDIESDALLFYGGVDTRAVSNRFGILSPFTGPDPTHKDKEVVLGFDLSYPPTKGETPPPLRGAAMIIFGKQLLLHGGVDDKNQYNSDMWVLALEGASAMTWRKLIFAMSPSGRAGHTITLVPSSIGSGFIKAVLFGGTDAQGNAMSDVWYFSGLPSTWKWERKVVRPAPGANEPVARYGHSAVATGPNTIVYYGGCDDLKGSCYDHVQSLDFERWLWAPVPASLSGSRLPAHAVRISALDEGTGVIRRSYRSHPSRGGSALVVLPSGNANEPGSRIVFTFGCEGLICSPRDNIRQVSVLNTDAVCPLSCVKGQGVYIEENGSALDLDSESMAYRDARCICKKDFFGKFCEQKYPCPGGCSGNGQCALETHSGNIIRFCKCTNGFWGVDCSIPPCPRNCSGRGVCLPGPDPVFLRPDLDRPRYVTLPSHNGTHYARLNSDVKIPVWLALGAAKDRRRLRSANIIANEVYASDVTDPSKPSLLALQTSATRYFTAPLQVQSHCSCRNGFTGPDCSLIRSYASKIRCPSDCSGHGLCDTHGKCVCSAGFSGSDCSIQCPSLCSDNGVCALDGKCVCAKGYRGRDCSKKWCPDNCNEHGTCVNGECKCEDGWGGRFCNVNTKCSGNGVFVDGKCQCRPGWGNAQCSQRIYCPSNCSGNGDCVILPERGPISQLLSRPVSSFDFPSEPDAPPSLSLGFLELDADAASVTETGHSEIEGVCRCKPGWRGSDCSRQVCATECVRGVCNDAGKCQCYPGFTGPDCRISTPCPGNCTSAVQGLCQQDGKCACQPGWSGPECNEPGCPLDCSNHGDCKNGRCTCNSGFGGFDCSLECPRGCSGNGDCIDGRCRCKPGFTGKDCSKPSRCPRNPFIHPHLDCSGHGFCFREARKCICEPGYTGKDCSQDDGSCGAGSCGNHGTCRRGQCDCDLGWSGAHCEYVNQCPNNCNQRGFCLDGKCKCFAGFSGTSCENFSESPKKCSKDCSNRGLCEDGKCMCTEGYTGEDCSEVTGFCKNNTCSGRGVCAFGKCICEPGAHGTNCEVTGCSACEEGKGVCVLGRCHCLPGFTGESCSQEVTCPGNGCSGRGICTLGKCSCMPGHTGEDCSKLVDDVKTCPGDCAGRGVCHLGKCFCIDGYAGADCSVLTVGTCPNNCGGAERGECFFGRCYCKLGFSGQGCENELRCPTKCEENGICMGGSCFCAPGYTGHDCQQLLKDVTRDKLYTADIDPVTGRSMLVELAALSHVVNDESTVVSTPAPKAVAEALAAEGQFTSFVALDETITRGTLDPTTLAELNKELSAGLSPTELAFLAQGSSTSTLDEPINAPVPDSKTKQDASSKPKKEKSDASKPALAPSSVKATPAPVKAPAAPSPAQKPAGACGAVSSCVHGMCVDDQCMCAPGYAGPNCNTTLVAREWKRCPDGCSSKGVCILGRCVCDLGFGGVNCSERRAIPCPRDCSGHGICHHGKCFCEPGFGGVACAVVIPCPSNCGTHGVCFRGRCVCATGFYGENCENRVPDAVAPASILASEDDLSLLRYTNLDLEDPRDLDTLLAPHAKAAKKQQTQAQAQAASTADAKTSATASTAATPAAAPAATDKKAAENTKTSFLSVEEELSAAFTMTADEQAFSCEFGCGANGRCVAGQCYCAPGFIGVLCERAVDLSELDEAEQLGAVVRVKVAKPESAAAPQASTGALSGYYQAVLSSMRGSSADSDAKVVPHVVAQSTSLPPAVLAGVSFFAGMLLFSVVRRVAGTKTKAL